jgi:hypothetical protein
VASRARATNGVLSRAVLSDAELRFQIFSSSFPSLPTSNITQQQHRQICRNPQISRRSLRVSQRDPPSIPTVLRLRSVFHSARATKNPIPTGAMTTCTISEGMDIQVAMRISHPPTTPHGRLLTGTAATRIVLLEQAAFPFRWSRHHLLI